jgi:putative ABC transport system permease protein
MVYARDGVDPNELARSLERDVAGIVTTGPSDMMRNVNSMISLLNAVVGSVAAIALLVGAFSIVNTMMMAVTERTREIGVKRALGATRGRVARDVLAESAVMGGMGGALGLAFGAVVAYGLNSALVAATGTSMFLVTGRLAVGAIVFSMALGAIGGLYPATRASRLDPALALAQR